MHEDDCVPEDDTQLLVWRLCSAGVNELILASCILCSRAGSPHSCIAAHVATQPCTEKQYHVQRQALAQ
jgi:hypothetical protein